MLAIRNISRIFGGLVALDKVNINIRKGEIRGLIGPNGSGKTTMINVITGFYVPSSGNIIFNDKDISGQSPYHITEQGLVRTFQNINLFSDMTAIENVATAYSLHMKNNLFSTVFNTSFFRKEERRSFEIAESILDFVGLKDKKDLRAKNLPYGQQRLLEIGRALATEPRLLLLDEPVAGMNDQESDEVAGLIQKLRDNGKMILLIEHHMKFVMSLCDKLTVLSSGNVIAEGTPREIQNNEDVIRIYLGKRRTVNAAH
ncbi:ABC transporter ATP-binding protein [Sporomusa sp. KB1]|uniref:ABC transporter ATP-binding protein n=1 Tax=Sporomusa sp. KB1 TaxID=943346 RepID=UPI0011AAA392|nr:ABC transporter ATP-binding protein [Sporomusa sp. KB1]TWH46198.1 branched-chain amino acid transport system ATP-binding protein [Sporomusa sp. KB1]